MAVIKIRESNTEHRHLEFQSWHIGDQVICIENIPPGKYPAIKGEIFTLACEPFKYSGNGPFVQFKERHTAESFQCQFFKKILPVKTKTLIKGD